MLTRISVQKDIGSAVTHVLVQQIVEVFEAPQNTSQRQH